VEEGRRSSSPLSLLCRRRWRNRVERRLLLRMSSNAALFGRVEAKPERRVRDESLECRERMSAGGGQWGIR